MVHQNVKTRKPARAASEPRPQPPDGSPPSVRTASFTRSAILVAAGIAVGALGLLGVQTLRSHPAPSASEPTAAQAMPASYYDLRAMSPDELAKVDIALMNLLCAKGLPGAESLHRPPPGAKPSEIALASPGELGVLRTPNLTVVRARRGRASVAAFSTGARRTRRPGLLAAHAIRRTRYRPTGDPESG